MSAVDLHVRLMAAGVSVEVSHDGPLPALRLTSSVVPPTALLDEVRQHKAGLIALLDAETPMLTPYAPGHRTGHRGSSDVERELKTADFWGDLSVKPDAPYAPYGFGPAASFLEQWAEEAWNYGEPKMPAPGTAARDRMDREHRAMCQGLLAMARKRW